MTWIYRVFGDSQGRYSIREVFYDRDRTIVNYSKPPIAVVGTLLLLKANSNQLVTGYWSLVTVK